MRRSLFWTLSAVLLLALLAACPALAVETGTCGDNATWTLDTSSANNYKLTISGSGPMKNYTSASGTPWYANRTKITSVTVSGVTTIGDYAFSGFTNLGYATLNGSTVTSVGKYAFNSCSSLRGFSYGSSPITSIGAYAFSGCTTLASFQLPSGLSSLGNYAFQNCSGTSFTSISVPATLTELPDYCFKGCTNLKTVTLPSALTRIGKYCFQSCTALTAITLPAGLQTLDNYAFQSSGLSSVFVPSGLTAFGTGVFSSCASLRTVEIGGPCTKVPSYTFSGCSSLSSVTLPSGLTAVDGYAFRNCTSLKTILLPGTLASIGTYAFNGCSALASLDLPPDITTITTPSSAFPSASITTLYCLAGSSTATVLTNANRAFTALNGSAWTWDSASGSSLVWSLNTATGLLQITGSLPDAQTTIAASSYPWYSQRTKVKSVLIDSASTYIGGNMFTSCTSLTAVSMPDGVTGIGSDAFAGCSQLRQINVPSGLSVIGASAFSNCTVLNAFPLPDTLTQIGNSAFAGTRLSSVRIPAGCLSLGTSAFRDCTYLQTLTIESDLPSIPANAFSNCTALNGVTLPQSVTAIGNQAFYNCTRLTTLILPGNISSVGTKAFHTASSRLTPTCRYSGSDATKAALTNAGYQYWLFDDAAQDGHADEVIWTLDPSRTELTISGSGPMRDLNYCAWPDITTLIVQSGVTRLSSSLCSYRAGLSSVTLPLSVSEIGQQAFEYCSSLTDLDFRFVRIVGSGAFRGSALTSVSASFFTDVGIQAFADCASLTSVNISPVTIGAGAFANCPVISLSLGNQVTSIGPSAFAGACGIDGLYLPETVTQVGMDAFSALPDQQVFLGNQISVIGDNAFGPASDDKVFICAAGSATEATLIQAGYLVSAQDVNTYGNGDPYYIENGVLHVGGKGGYDFYYNTSYDSPPWYSQRASIHKIVIENTVKTIGSKSFIDLSNVTEVVIPSSVTSIRGNAFNAALPSVILPDNIASFRHYAVLILDDYEYNGAFADSTQIYCRAGSQTAAALDDVEHSYIGFLGMGRAGSLKWMMQADGTLRVYGNGPIPDYTFASEQPWYDYRGSVTAVVLEPGVTAVGSAAFLDLENLASVSLPAGVTRIGKDAFRGDPLLTALDLPDSVTEIGEFAFRNTGISELTLPAALEQAAPDFLYGADGLAAVHTAEGNALFTSQDGVLFSIDQTELVYYPPQRNAAGYFVPEGTLSVADYAFFTEYRPNGTLDLIVLPESLTEVGHLSFGSNTSRIPGTLCFLGDMPAFSGSGPFSNKPADAYYPLSRAGSWQDPPAPGGITWHPFCEFRDGGMILEHTLEAVEGTPASCLEPGVADHYRCTVCGGLFADELGETLITQEQTILPALDHEWTEPAYTLSEDKTLLIAYRACTRCDYSEEESSPVTSQVTLEPACDHPGETTYFSQAYENAAFTAQELVLQDIDPLPHTPLSIEGYPATCTEEGLMDEIFCTVCGNLIQEAAPIPPLGHDWTLDESEWAEDGSACTMRLTCARCGEALETPASVTAEAEENTSCAEWAHTVYTAVFTEGEVTVTDTMTLENVPPIPHMPEVLPAVPATCTDPGLTEGERCAVCGLVTAVQDEIPPLGHLWALSGADWAEDGSACTMHLTCERCGEALDTPASVTAQPDENTSCTEWAYTVYTAAFTEGDLTLTDTLTLQDVPPAPHTEAVEPGIPPTDREPGLTERRYCAVCGEELLAARELPALWSYTDDGLTVTGYNGDQTDLTIPEGVTALGADLFKNNASVTSVYVPDAVTEIGATTFFNASGLTEIRLPDTLNGITSRTFYNVSAVFRVNAGTLTAKALSYNKIAFTDASGWTMIYPLRTASDEPASVNLVRIPDDGEAELTVPADIAGVPVTELSNGAAAGHAELTDVWLPDSLSVFGENVFAGCADPLTVHTSMTAPGREWALEQGYHWVHGPHTPEVLPAVAPTCTESGLTEGLRCADCGEILTAQEPVPASGHEWGEPVYTWAEDHSAVTAERVCLHDGTHRETETARAELLVLALPARTVAGMFLRTASFEDPAFDTQTETARTIPALGELKTLYLPESLRAVRAESFRQTAFQVVIIPDGCASIGENAFADCPDLLYVFIPASVTEIGEGAFSNCPLVFIYREE